jgi:transcriptional regulator with XRE-family HTH domain
MAGFTYKSYSFIDKDPLIDEMRTIVQQHGASYKDIHEQSGVSASTLTAWFAGATRKPQAATVNAVARSMGWKLGLVPFDAKPLVLPTPAPPKAEPVKPSSMRHVVKMAQYRKGARR